ncbi:hypothetical protein B0H34DRAFT_126325 [Crassisporium funariophilum]|nr:hypothetical protein B0H34DRAFT_126325 [Crassisporium funariophilum]
MSVSTTRFVTSAEDDETTPLLPQTLPPVSGTEPIPQRVHYLDNLRATLTLFLIFHHSVKEALRSPIDHTIALPLPFAPLSATTDAFLWGCFYFVSGYASLLSLTSKPSIVRFFLVKTIRIGVPAVAYIFPGQWALLFLLHIFISDWTMPHEIWAYIRFDDR